MSAEAPLEQPALTISYAGEIDPDERRQISGLLESWDPGLFAGELSVSILVGGANNRNYVVETGARKYALRIASKHSELLAVNRDNAVQAQRDAHRGALAPMIFATKLPEGHVLSEFVEGEVLGDEHLTETAVLESVGATLARLHRLETSAQLFTPFSDIRQWAQAAYGAGGELPTDYGDLLSWVWRIEDAIAELDLPRVLCHNDTVPQNFIRTDTGLCLVDWDYAGRGLAAFELASFCATAGLAPEAQRTVLGAYCEESGSGEPSDSQLVRISCLRYVATMREVAWVLMATPILKGTTTPADAEFYEKYLHTHLAMARQTNASGALGEMIDVVGSDREAPW